MRKFLKVLVAIVAIVAVSALAVEGLLQLAVRYVLKAEKIFENDPDTGWRVLPDIDKVRANPAGDPWRIHTDAEGHRIFPGYDDGDHTILLLGDSHGFAEGVNVEDAYFQVLKTRLPDYRIENTSVSGFGTDQEYIAARPYLERLGEGDAVVVLFYLNDFYDVLREQFAGRPKPYFKPTASGFELVMPEIGWFEVLRNNSFALALLGRLGEPSSSDDVWDFSEAAAIIREAFRRMNAELDPGVERVLAYSGHGEDFGIPATYTGKMFCDQFDLCVDLDASLKGDPSVYLPDGHWNAKGNRIVGDAIADALANPAPAR